MELSAEALETMKRAGLTKHSLVALIRKGNVEELESRIAVALDAPSATAVPADDRHPEDYCHRCSGPNISWYAPSLLWNQFVRDKGEPEIICPLCFVRLAEAAAFNVTWSLVPDGVTSDYDERLAVRAAQKIINATIQSEEEAAVIVRDALVQSAAALAAARSAPDLEAAARKAAQKIVDIAYRDRGQVPHRDTITNIILETMKGVDHA